MICPICHSDNTDDSTYCKKCATPLPFSAGSNPASTLTIPPSRELEIGAIFAGRFHVIEELGEGGMGRVYKAMDMNVREKVALKILSPAIASDKTTIERFRNELKLARRIAHRNVCRMFDLNEADGLFFITMEYIAGEDLRTTIRRVGPLSPGRAVRIAREVANGLAEAHRQGIVHRDLKPQNVMIDLDGCAHVMDFGIALGLKDRSMTGTGLIIGTPEYMSPEQIGSEGTDQRADIYALGVVMFEMLTGRVPFEGDTALSIAYKQKNERPPDPRKLNPQIGRELSAMILKCLEKDRDRRYQKAEDLAADMDRIQKSLSTLERPSPRKKPTTRKSGRVTVRLKKWAFPAAGIIGLAGILLLAVFLPFRPAAERTGTPVHKQITFIGNTDFPALSPDGKFVAYLENTAADRQQVMVQDLSGGLPIKVAESYRISSLRWLPGGAELSFLSLSDREKAFDFQVIPRLGGEARSFGSLRQVAWGSEGTRFAHIRGNEILITEKSTSEARSIPLQGTFSQIGEMDWSPDGRWIVFRTIDANRRYVLWTISPDKGGQKKILETSSEVGPPRWSSKQPAVYYFQNQGPTTDLWKIAISPKTGSPEGPPTLVLTGLPAGGSLSLSEDGKKLAYSRKQAISNLWAAWLDEAPPAPKVKSRALTTGTRTHDFPSVSPDGRSIAFTRGEGRISEVFVMSLDGESQRQITFLNSTNYAPAWSPDGREIAFISLEGGKPRLWKVGSRGENPQPLKADRLWGNSLSWQPGARILYQMEGNTNCGVFDPRTAQSAALLKDAIGNVFNPRVSPNGKNVAVFWNRREGRGLWLISQEDISQRLLRAGDLLPVGWTSDGRWVLAINGRSPQFTVVAVEVASGTEKSVLSLAVDREQGVPGTFSVSMTPDGKKFFFAVHKNQSDVWLVENFDPEIG